MGRLVRHRTESSGKSASMTEVLTLSQGGYRFIKGVFQYSAGVAAEPGFEIVRARFPDLVPIADGFRRIQQHLSAIGRPISAFCACELRSPMPFDDASFRDFNRGYVEPLRGWGLIRDGINPIARSNVCPEITPPSEPSFMHSATRSRLRRMGRGAS